MEGIDPNSLLLIPSKDFKASTILSEKFDKTGLITKVQKNQC